MANVRATLRWMILGLVLLTLSVGAAVSVQASGLATVTGEVWFDVNGNGVREDSEPLLPQHPVTLVGYGVDGPGVLALRLVTDANGRFTFGNIEYGEYVLNAGDGAALDITVSNERSSATVALGVIGQRIFLPLLQR